MNEMSNMIYLDSLAGWSNAVKKFLRTSGFLYPVVLIWMALFFAACSPSTAFPLQPGDIVLENEHIKTVISQQGGRIVSFYWKEKEVEFTVRGEDYTGGMAKERLYGVGEWEFAKAIFKVIEQNETSLVLEATGTTEPFDRVKLTKKISLPQGKSYLKIDSEFKNINPIMGSVELVPWIHNIVDIPPGTDFYLSHSEGVYLSTADGLQIESSIRQSGGNWLAYYNKERGAGLLFIASAVPNFFYQYAGKKNIGTLEMIFDKTFAMPSEKISYYFAPVKNLNQEEFAASGLEMELTPTLPNRGESLSLAKGKALAFSDISGDVSEKDQKISVQYWMPKAYVCPDTAFPLIFGLKTSRAKEGFPRVIFEIPAEFTLEASVPAYWWFHDEAISLADKQRIDRGGEPYVRYVLNVEKLKNYNLMWARQIRIFLGTDLKEGQYTIYYYSEVDGERSVEKSVPVEIVEIAPVQKLSKKFITGIEVDYMLMQHYPEYEKNLKNLGFNHLVFNYNISTSAGKSTSRVDGQQSDFDQARTFLDNLKKAGFGLSVMGAQFFMPPYTGTNDALKAKDYQGNLVDRFDFTARGDWMENVAGLFKKNAKLGFDLIISDYEAYFGGDAVSFTETTLAIFQDYFSKKHKDLDYVSPVEIVKNPGKYPQHEAIWINFKCEQFADYTLSIVEMVKKDFPKVKIGVCTIPGATDEATRRDNLQDHTSWSSFLDYNSPMQYDNVYNQMGKAAAHSDLLGALIKKGDRAVYMPTLSGGYPDGGPIWKSNAPNNKYIILETVTSGAKGYWFWPGFAGLNGMDLAYIAQANTIIAQIEDLLYYGERKDELVTVIDAKNLRWNLTTKIAPKVIKYKDELAVYVADYSSDDVRIRLSANFPDDHAVYDMDTGEKVGDGKAWDVVLSGNMRGKMFHIRKK